MFFWNPLAFSMIKQMLAIWSLVPLLFLNPAWTSGSSRFTYCWSLAGKILSHYFASMWNECTCVVVWTFFGIASLWDWNENWPFPVLWPLLSFPNMLAYWVAYSWHILPLDSSNYLKTCPEYPSGEWEPWNEVTCIAKDIQGQPTARRPQDM